MSDRGISAVSGAFESYRDSDDAALVVYLMAGYPNSEQSMSCARAALEAGADLLEIGVPFSDPVADGKVIQKASDVALESGMTLALAMDFVSELRKDFEEPIVLMSYLNPIYKMGFSKFVERAKSKGIDGVIIPDLIPDEAAEYMKIAKENNFALVFLASSNGADDRLVQACQTTQGFLYTLALAGVTGEREELDSSLLPYLDRLKALRDKSGSEIPLAVGFGVSKPEHFNALKSHVEGIVVGSAIVRRSGECAEAVREFVSDLRGT
ncbi:MAG: tryptophan synthase subunit alpha [Candidatus Lindowbacteria bacterium]|nr:tryptophan synthase subunit alpha [Candidatus Lindowbacteria bacterium]